MSNLKKYSDPLQLQSTKNLLTWSDLNTSIGITVTRLWWNNSYINWFLRFSKGVWLIHKYANTNIKEKTCLKLYCAYYWYCKGNNLFLCMFFLLRLFVSQQEFAINIYTQFLFHSIVSTRSTRSATLRMC